MTGTFSTELLVVCGTDPHKERYLLRITEGEMLVCTGVTEPNAGTDTSRIETVSERDDDDWINREKIWTSKAEEADVIMLLTRTAPGEKNWLGGMTLFFYRPSRPSVRGRTEIEEE